MASIERPKNEFRPRRQRRRKKRITPLFADHRPRAWWHEFADKTRAGVHALGRLRSRSIYVRPHTFEVPKWWLPLRHALVSLAVIMPVLTFKYGAAWKAALHSRQGQALVADALEKTKPGQEERLVSQLTPALSQHPKEPSVLRTLAWAAADSFPQQAKTLFYRLIDLGAANATDELRLAQLLGDLGDTTAGQELFAKVLEREPENVKAWVLCGDAARKAGDFVKAQAAYLRAQQLAPDDLDAIIGLGETLRRSADPVAHSQGCGVVLEQLAQAVKSQDKERALRLARVLIDLDVVDMSQREKLAALLSKLPESSAELKLAAVEFSFPAGLADDALHTKHQRWSAVLANISSLEPENLPAALGWLQKTGDHEFVLEWATSDKAVTHADVFQVRLFSLLATSQVQEAAGLAALPAAPLRSTSPALLRALEVFRTSRTEFQARENLLEALEKAAVEKSAAGSFGVGMVALEMHQDAVAEQALRKALEHDQAAELLLPVEPYILAARRAGVDVTSILELLVRCEDRQPQNLSVRKEAAYARLLKGEKLDQTAALVGHLQEALPNDAYLRFLNSFARYRQGDFVGALSGLVPLPRYRWHQGEAAVIASILASAGRFQEATALASSVTGGGLFNEERQILEPWMTRIRMQAGTSAHPLAQGN